MIPKKISLENFMCFRAAALDFSGFRVACLAGDNGAGKSALLDALTWALWGRSRARRDDELIYYGADEMAVEFTFGLGGQTYRVARRRRAGKRGSTLLEFQVGQREDWRCLSETTIRGTQAKIETVLRLDYATFVNSAFIRQGRADEFTTKTAGERKRVLSDILNLDRWVDYENRVKERQTAVRSQVALAELRLREIDEEVENLPRYEADYAAAQVTLADLSASVKVAQAEAGRIEAARTAMRHCLSQIDDLERRISDAERELQRLAGERTGLRTEVAELDGLLADADSISAGYCTYLEAVGRERALGAKLLESVELTARRSELEVHIANARRELETERDVLGQRIADLQDRLPDPAEVAEREEALARIAHLTSLSESRDAARVDLARLAEERATLRAQNEALREDMLSLSSRIAQLEQAQASCPLCEQPLSESHRRSLLGQFQIEGGAMGDRYRANQARDAQLASQASALERQVAEVAGRVKPLDSLRRREAALGERIDRGELLQEELIQAKGALEAVTARLADENYGAEFRQALQAVLDAAAQLGYDQDAHKRARRQVGELQVFAERRERLASAESRRSEARTALERVASEENEWLERRDAETRLRREREEEVARLNDELKRAGAIEAALDRTRRQEAEARQALGAAIQRIEACKALKAQRSERSERLESLAQEQGAYHELRTAFGVRGVPAMIIEAAVPEIEAEANRLLARMTAGRMHMQLFTQRETQAGELRETLEIAISDELGTRPYEMYSGGEQYRINFALRVALSRLLARRAGAQLETLVVDEGFGTQDADGRQRLVEAIGVVREDFERILVITHIDELKDAFPVRIEVSKTPDGSVIEVI